MNHLFPLFMEIEVVCGKTVLRYAMLVINYHIIIITSFYLTSIKKYVFPRKVWPALRNPSYSEELKFKFNRNTHSSRI